MSSARKSALIFGLSTLMWLLPVADLFAHSWCQTRNRCRWWRKEYVAGATVGCIGFSLPLCYKRSASCGTAYASCGPKHCLWGQARAWAQNSSSGCSKGGWRTGQGIYGDPVEHFDVTEAPLDAAGDHQMSSRVEFDPDRRQVAIHFDEVMMKSTVDSSYSRIDVYLFLDDDKLPEEEVQPTPDNTLWSGYLESRDGRLVSEGLDSLAKAFRSAGAEATLEARGVVESIPFFGSDDEWERLTVQVVIDGGHTADR
ncbi:MAG: hypothetical protein AAF604_20915 [Acidobacteriota bacterium]